MCQETNLVFINGWISCRVKGFAFHVFEIKINIYILFFFRLPFPKTNRFDDCNKYRRDENSVNVYDTP